jgi:hypothetical protein
MLMLRSARPRSAIEQYRHNWRQPGDNIARADKKLSRIRHRLTFPVTSNALQIATATLRVGHITIGAGFDPSASQQDELHPPRSRKAAG